MPTTPIVRFAPSPTGHLHVGGLRTALFNFLYARKNGGKFLLRIEDTDVSRNSVEATEAIVKAFEWVGLAYDGEAVFQSRRMEIYQRHIDKLLSEGKAYRCYMSKEELDALREEQKSRGETPRYDNRYRDFKGKMPQNTPFVVRIKAPLEGMIEFEDGVKGLVRTAAKELDDFVIARSDGSPTYNFVVTVDDALMEITDVIRGDDHLSNTPKQIVLYEAFGFKIPRFYHVPMILNPQGHKLSKRDGAMSVMDYKRAGYLPEAVLNFLVRLGWSHGDKEIFSLEEMLEFFSPEELNSSPSSYSPEKLLWLNAHYLKKLPGDKLEELLKEFDCPFVPLPQRDVLYDALKERVQTLKDFALAAKEILTPPKTYDEKSLKKLPAGAGKILSGFVASLEGVSLKTPEEFDALLKKFILERSLKPGDLMQPLRIALLGKPGGIGLAEAMAILTQGEIIKRLARFAAFTF